MSGTLFSNVNNIQENHKNYNYRMMQYGATLYGHHKSA